VWFGRQQEATDFIDICIANTPPTVFVLQQNPNTHTHTHTHTKHFIHIKRVKRVEVKEANRRTLDLFVARPTTRMRADSLYYITHADELK